MLWFFEKHQARLHYEIRRQADGDSCELVVTHPDGREEIAIDSDIRALLQRAQDLRRRLIAAGWQTPGGLRRTRPSSHPPGSGSDPRTGV